MATRVNRKNATTTSPKEVVSSEKSSAKNEVVIDTPKNTVVTKSIGKRLAKNNPKKIIKKPTLTVTLKAKAKKSLKLNPLAKAVLHTANTSESKKKLLKNGIKEVKSRKKRVAKLEIKKENDDSPPVLEPIFPLEENVKKNTKKRVAKKIKEESTELLDISKIKVENEEISSDITDDIPTLSRQVKKPRVIKKSKLETESLEDVMNDLSYLIKGDDTRTEVDSLSESSKSDTFKPKKLTKKQKLELLNRDLIKKDKLENTLSKLDSADEKIIDMLDLNVNMVKKKSSIAKRRHSIEKCPISSEDNTIDTLNIFNPLPRSPRAKRKTKQENSSRKSSPYSTRSDSPARILRNGKQRKLKLGLLEGLDLEIKKRRRFGSDLGSELSGSKLSGNESDSSYSDLSSLHGTESNEALKEDIDIKPNISTAPNGPITNVGLIDTFSNVYNNTEITTEPLSDKNLLLDIMKQTFNEVELKKTNKFEVCTVVSSRFYGKRNTQSKSETIKDNIVTETNEKIADEAPPLIENTLSTAVQEIVKHQPVISNKNSETTTETVENVTDNHNNKIKESDNLETLTDNQDDGENVQCEETKSVVSESAPNTATKIEETIYTENPEITENVENLESTHIKTSEIEDGNISESIETTAAIENTNTMENSDKTNVENRCEEDMDICEGITENLEQSVSDVPELSGLEISTYNNIEIAPVLSETLTENDTLVLNEEMPILKPEYPPEYLNEGEIPVIHEEPLHTDHKETLSINNTNEDTEDQAYSEPGSASKEPQMEIETMKVDKNNVNTNLTDDNAVIKNKEECNLAVGEPAENLVEKESILKALGLQRSQATEEDTKKKTKVKPSGSRGESYTGTLKTVIKLNRDKKKGGRGIVKSSSLQKTKSKSNASTEDEQAVISEETNKGNKEKEASSLTWKQGTHSSDTAGAHRKSHYSNRSNMDGSSEHTSDGESAAQDGAIKALVIPEKASSFSIHPGRLCKDECSYCFGKFGLFDTPCHIAQMKSIDRQDRILETEKHLTRNSCLCDACYRHVDRKSNTPSYMNKSLKRNSLVAPGPRQNHCHVLGCSKEASNILRRKWIIKMRKSICQVINLDLDNPGLHSIPICEEHYAALEHLMICAMCKRRLARNHIHYLGPETTELNNALASNGIPLKLSDKPVVCKLCKCFASIILKDPTDRLETSVKFFVEYKKRLLHFNDIVPMDESAAEEPIAVPSRAERIENLKKKKKLFKNPAAMDFNDDGLDEPKNREERVPSTDTNSQPQSRSESPSDEYNGVDYNTLIPAIAMEEGSDGESKKDTKQPNIFKKLTEMQREGVEIVKIVKTDKPRSNEAVNRIGINQALSVRQLLPGEEYISLNGNIDFANIKEKTPEGWEKCTSVIQYDEETKRLWQELQKPYGNQSSFLRHLILLEKYFRNGDLVLSPNASHHSINYSESVHNRLRAYDNIPTSAGNIQPLSMIPFNKLSSNKTVTTGIMNSAVNNSTPIYSSINLTNTTTSKPIGSTAMSVTSIPINVTRSAPLTISQLNSPPLLPSTANFQPIRPKMGTPPGLISLHPGTVRPIAPLVKVPQHQKIKFPITKNWRPNLIPIDTTKKTERKTGLVQVISGGKPYHITLEDYKKMCAIKRSFELKQKRLQEAQNPKPILVTHNSVLKSIIPKKGLVISKTTPFSSASKSEAVNQPSMPEGVPEGENILEKLDKQVEKLESKLNEKTTSLLLPRIPKSLTVIPQTVPRKTSRPSSPVLLITKNNSSKS
ncbi:uncharacterized protein LOC130890741 isoform X1 [Diorhabda carinulata]|uniref:uncharacterized protein LOC130890741 isoform X1 n=1 Tax=Diorhabda carinulata TaxID=1163345 RepID=UPI0025A1FDFD|nr:uncharacterized protein LOC130890741 isoform X1 [Diorhabda carinulata]XP_057650991.1 uncharacterized protein LOC130890741 isoform X1 [Diorhabda carinulata]XP_057650992.1 uncharacterized protein LOC130890741 isoform X1 [Diorhabda carinulata]XP_057650994.1 uncharacterized protein LOC130890741 isoform X1 [Diorhabda carinulata]XP_057650995.1 uncharacterized protein LOC130890741 isoform X1 [Diorhabda carinulata]XP_057650996.1 uncharacterized protein LOC130890741 isoform X1 [Diorhabda carinulata]